MGDCGAAVFLLSAVTKAGGDPIDREMDTSLDSRIRCAGAMATEKLNLNMIERIDIWEPIAYRAREERIALEQRTLLRDRQDRLHGPMPFAVKPTEDCLPKLWLGDQLGIS